jgi:hypothetical protein
MKLPNNSLFYLLKLDTTYKGSCGMVSRLRNPYFWAAVVILLVTVYLSFGTHVGWFQLGFFVGPYRFNHWLGWIGVVFVAVYTPLYHFLKRRYPKRAKALLGTHVIGNLLSFLLISVHFASQLGRPAQFFPDLGTGIILYAMVTIMVATGILQRFQIVSSFLRKWRFLHTSMATSFYLVILVHILHGLGFL